MGNDSPESQSSGPTSGVRNGSKLFNVTAKGAEVYDKTGGRKTALGYVGGFLVQDQTRQEGCRKWYDLLVVGGSLAIAELAAQVLGIDTPTVGTTGSTFSSRDVSVVSIFGSPYHSYGSCIVVRWDPDPTTGGNIAREIWLSDDGFGHDNDEKAKFSAAEQACQTVGMQTERAPVVGLNVPISQGAVIRDRQNGKDISRWKVGAFSVRMGDGKQGCDRWYDQIYVGNNDKVAKRVANDNGVHSPPASSFGSTFSSRNVTVQLVSDDGKKITALSRQYCVVSGFVAQDGKYTATEVWVSDQPFNNDDNEKRVAAHADFHCKVPKLP